MNKKIISISLMIILTSIITILFEMQAYTPIDKDQNEIIRNYDSVATRETYLIMKKRKEVKVANVKADEYIKKYGVIKILNPQLGGKHDKKERKIICELENALCSLEAGYRDYASPAVKFDLNDDHTDEIIGVLNDGCEEMGCGLFVAKKYNKEYKKIFDSLGWALFPVTIINHKTDGYYDLLVTSGNKYGGFMRNIVKYNIAKKEYQYIN